MPRPPTPVGAWGKISRERIAPGVWRARARFRDFSGRSRLVEAQGTTGAQAQRLLEERLRLRAHPGDEDITPGMTIAVLGKRWLDEKARADIAAQTIERYTHAFDKHVVPGIGDLRIREATVGAIDRFLVGVGERSTSTAKTCKVVLSGMLGLAVRHDALRANPVRDVAPAKRQKSAVRALTVEEVQALRRGVRAWVDDPAQVGQRRSPDLPDIVDLLLATGARIGELCAVRWADVDLSAERPTLTIAGTVITVRGQGLQRQDHPKSAAGHRTVVLPRFAVDVLLRRQVSSASNPLDLVFPSSRGTLRAPGNVRRPWRDAREAIGYGWVVPHSFRKAVATLVDAEHSTKAAASMLGHSGTAITEKHYIGRAALAPDVSDALQVFGQNDE